MRDTTQSHAQVPDIPLVHPGTSPPCQTKERLVVALAAQRVTLCGCGYGGVKAGAKVELSISGHPSWRGDAAVAALPGSGIGFAVGRVLPWPSSKGEDAFFVQCNIKLDSFCAVHL